MSKTIEPLWPNGKKIEVLGLTGDYESGKTMFALSIDPANTLLYDFEKSASTYEADLPIKRIDFVDRMQKLFKGHYKPVDTFRTWLESIEKIEPGQFSVIVVDTIGDIETGLADYVASRYEDYRFKSEDSFRSTGGIFWSYVKDNWKTTLALLSNKCQTFVFTAHLRSVWVNGKPTSRKEPKGKETLLELASLYLWLDRSPDNKGVVPDCPSAVLLKSRLASSSVDEYRNMKITPMLPPRIERATPAEIRRYIESPPDYHKLKAAEKIQTHKMSDDERAILENETATSKAEAETAALARIDRQIELRRLMDTAAQDSATEAVVSASQPVDTKPALRTASSNGDKVKSTPTTVAESTGHEQDLRKSCSDEQQAEIKRLFGVLEYTKEQAVHRLETFGVNRLANLTGAQAQTLIGKLSGEVSTMELEARL